MVSTKLDEPLIARVHALEHTGLRDGAAEFARLERIKVSVRFTGDLAVVEEAGLWMEFRSERVAVGTIAAADLERVAELDNVVSIQSNRRARLLSRTGESTTRNDLVDAADPVHAFAPDLTGRGVVVGIIDSGVDIFHPAFRKPDGTTRIVSLYDLTLRHTLVAEGNPTGGTLALAWQPPGPLQDQLTPALSLPLTAATVQSALNAFAGIAPGDVTVTGGPLPTTPMVIDFGGHYDGTIFDTATLNAIRVGAMLTGGTHPTIAVKPGRIFTPADINAALTATTPAPFVSRDWHKHGSHIAGIAAGFGPPGCCSGKRTVGIAYDADLVIVRSALGDAENIQGVDYIFDQPWRAPGTGIRPAVVNMSFGGEETAHDGTDNFETMLDDRPAGSTKRSIVVAAGNDGGLYTPPAPGAHPREQFQLGRARRRSGHLVATGHQPRQQPPPDDPGSACHEHPHDHHLPHLEVCLRNPRRDSRGRL